nr:cytochrome c-type biogenesis CcmF C-terminal domain-containing protein [Marinicella sp. W31]MDC2876575.1 cytochrome c-type biogenesis CcmF C-terminal domain-containing protein [Marinicella sp. W31]
MFRSGFGRMPLSRVWPRFAGLPRSAFGAALAHFGLGVTVLGIVAVSLYETEAVLEMSPGMTVDAGGYTVTFEGTTPVTGPNYVDERGLFKISQDGQVIRDSYSAKRVYLSNNMPTTEAGISTFGLSQLYVSLGDERTDGAWVVRVWWKPFILCIWLGGVAMALGGVASITDRRLRVGAPERSRKRRLSAATQAGAAE